jgi:hypothetical protein
MRNIAGRKSVRERAVRCKPPARRLSCSCNSRPLVDQFGSRLQMAARSLVFRPLLRTWCPPLHTCQIEHVVERLDSWWRCKDLGHLAGYRQIGLPIIDVVSLEDPLESMAEIRRFRLDGEPIGDAKILDEGRSLLVCGIRNFALISRNEKDGQLPRRGVQAA